MAILESRVPADGASPRWAFTGRHRGLRQRGHNFDLPACEDLSDRFEVAGVADPLPERLESERTRAGLTAGQARAKPRELRPEATLMLLTSARRSAPFHQAPACINSTEEGDLVEGLALCRFESDGPGAPRVAALVNVGWGLGPGGIDVSPAADAWPSATGTLARFSGRRSSR